MAAIFRMGIIAEAVAQLSGQRQSGRVGRIDLLQAVVVQHAEEFLLRVKSITCVAEPQFFQHTDGTLVIVVGANDNAADA